MQELRCPIDGRPVGRGDRLMSEAHAEDRNVTGALAHDVHAHPGILWSARSRTQENAVIRAGLGGRDLVISTDGDVSAQLREVLHEVEHEGVVIVDDQDPGHSDIVVLAARRRLQRVGQEAGDAPLAASGLAKSMEIGPSYAGRV